MTIRSKKHVAIIEPSLIVSEGLKHVLEKIIHIELAVIYSDIESFLQRQNETFDYIFINPILIYNQEQDVFLQIQGSHIRGSIIALVYNYVGQTALRQFDTHVYIDDAKEVIQKKLKNASPSPKESSTNANGHTDLSDREKEILVSISKGKTNKEIADEHCISIHTVISHRKNVTRKTGIRSVSGLTVYALLNKLIDYSDLE